MDRAQLLDFATSAQASRASLFYVDVIFRGETVRVHISPGDPSLDLGSGGFRSGATWRVRVPATLQPAPAAKEVMTEIATGRKFYVTTCIPAPPDSAMVREHIVEAQLA